MEKSRGMIFLCLCLFGTMAFAQGPCQDIKSFAVLIKGNQYTVSQCDSLYAIHPSLFQEYRNLYVEVERLRQLDSLNADLSEQYKETMSTYEGMIQELKGFINVQDTAITKFDRSLVLADTLISQSTRNTDRALDEIRKERIKGRLLMIGGMLAGTLTGYFLGKGL